MILTVIIEDDQYLVKGITFGPVTLLDVGPRKFAARFFLAMCFELNYMYNMDSILLSRCYGNFP